MKRADPQAAVFYKARRLISEHPALLMQLPRRALATLQELHDVC